MSREENKASGRSSHSQRGLNSQFMKLLVAKEHLLHKVQEVLVPPTQFEKEMPDWAALFYIGQSVNMSEEPVDSLSEVLEYLTGIVLPTSFDQRNYRVSENTMRSIYAITLSLTSIRCIERLLHDAALVGFICHIAGQPAKKSFFEAMFVDTSQRKAAIGEAEKLLMLWTDLTMVYQQEFPVLWEHYRLYKQTKAQSQILARVSGAKPHEDHDFDGLRLIMHNFDRQFVDVPIVSVQSDLPSEREWLISAHENEASKAFAIAFVMRDLAEAAPEQSQSVEVQEKRETLVPKLTFMYHYCMNFRSKYTRELKTNVRRRVITSEQHEEGTFHISQISHALKESKSVVDRKKFQIKSQLQGTMVESHQKWVHLSEQRAEQKRLEAEEQRAQEENKESGTVMIDTTDQQKAPPVQIIDLGSLK